jgi:hypothetical protein
VEAGVFYDGRFTCAVVPVVLTAADFCLEELRAAAERVCVCVRADWRRTVAHPSSSRCSFILHHRTLSGMTKFAGTIPAELSTMTNLTHL